MRSGHNTCRIFESAFISPNFQKKKKGRNSWAGPPNGGSGGIFAAVRHQHWRQHGGKHNSSVAVVGAVAAARWWRPAWQRQWQLGGSTALTAVVLAAAGDAAWQRQWRRQHGSGGGSAAQSVVAARQLLHGRQQRGSSLAAAWWRWWQWRLQGRQRWRQGWCKNGGGGGSMMTNDYNN